MFAPLALKVQKEQVFAPLAMKGQKEQVFAPLALNQRSPAEGKGNRQKEQVFAPLALKGQKLLAQGIALGNVGNQQSAL